MIGPRAGQILKTARLRVGLKQYVLGEMLGCTNQRAAQALVHRIETGNCRRVDQIMAACRVLGVDERAGVLEWVATERPCG